MLTLQQFIIIKTFEVFTIIKTLEVFTRKYYGKALAIRGKAFERNFLQEHGGITAMWKVEDDNHVMECNQVKIILLILLIG